MINADGGDVPHAHQFGRFDPAMPGDDSVGGVDQYRIDKPEFFNAGLDLLDLLSSVSARIAGARPQLRGGLIGDFQGCQGTLPKSAENQRPIAFHFAKAAQILGAERV